MVAYVDGGVDVFNALCYSKPSERDIAFFENNRSTFLNTVGAMGRNFYESVRDTFQTNVNQMYQYAQAAISKVASIWDIDIIKPLSTLVDIQFPPHCMIKWIMANKRVRQLYHKGQVAGYGDEYTDPEPNVIDDHHEWKMVMNGMEQYDEEDEITVWTTYCETYPDIEALSMNKLTFEEKLAIIETWYSLESLIDDMQEDPTSQYSAML